MRRELRSGGKAYPACVLALVMPVCVAGAAVVVAALVSLAADPPSGTVLGGVVVLLVASMVAERFPVPVEGVDAGGVSLSFVFGVGAIILFGWDAGVLVCFGAPIVMQLIERRPALRVAYNASVFALAAAVTGSALTLVDSGGDAALVARVGLAGLLQYAVNVTLVSAAVTVSSRRPFGPLVRSNVRWTALSFALMTSASLALVVLWERAAPFSAAILGPLLAIGLYQRSSHNALRSMRLALTDPLTSLGNHRHFHERLKHELDQAKRRGRALTLCLLDIDDFKNVNDRFGHPAGDRLLTRLAGNFRQNGDTFRLGGDEFAILVPGAHEAEALERMQAVIRRIEGLRLEQIGAITISAGISCYPDHGSSVDELVRFADSALYRAKEQGKNCARVYRPADVEYAELRRLADKRDRVARFQAAASLSRAVDARDTYTGSHSGRVAELAAGIGTRLGLDEDSVELLRVAGSLHDLGKLHIPEELLRKPGALTEAERLVLERHPGIGFRMLESLGVEPICSWVLRHHEHWDGSGYPDGLAGESIPLGARILLVADAYDAITSDRSYRRRSAGDQALAEIRRCAGTQFDPVVVDALTAELEGRRAPLTLAAVG